MSTALPPASILPVAAPRARRRWNRARGDPLDSFEELGTAALRYHEVGAEAEALRLIDQESDRAWTPTEGLELAGTDRP